MKCLLIAIVGLAVYVALIAFSGLCFDLGWDLIRWIWSGVFNVALPDVEYPYFVLLALILSIFGGSSVKASN